MHFKKFAAKTSTEHSRCERLREKVGVKIFFDNTFIFFPLPDLQEHIHENCSCIQVVMYLNVITVTVMHKTKS